MARKPLAEKTVAENCLKWGTGGINIDESRVEGIPPSVPQPRLGVKKAEIYNFATGEGRNGEMSNSTLGRFPANLIHDNSEEVRECFPETGGGNGKPITAGDFGKSGIYGKAKGATTQSFADSGNTSRFFKSIIYQAKASKSERNKGCEGLEERPSQKMGAGIVSNVGNGTPGTTESGDRVARNNHPTVKSVALMEYLITMVTPKGGTVLDPFMGSGSTGVACKNLDRHFIGIEKDKDYYEIAKKRICNQ